MTETALTESDRARDQRTDTYAAHEVLGYVEKNHTMNGRPCNHPWAVMRFRRTGSIGFYCGECRVGAHGGGTYEALLQRTSIVDATNPNSQGYPSKGGPASVKAWFEHGVYHVPTDRLPDAPNY